MGHKIAIDDFGTGYSSLSYLQRFPVDYLKLDGSFMDNFSEKSASKDLIAATISLTHSLQLKMIAESVETEAQCEFLREHGCDIVQGYYFSKPLPKENVIPFINSFVTSQERIKENLTG
jgi:EAL domain-containing protein (putative c-di-GMP-specific phosphodiesterase class I)